MWIPGNSQHRRCKGLEGRTHRFKRCISSMRVVFSIDLASTRIFGVRGELASLSGLKPMTALRMRVDVDGRVRTRIGRQFSVPSTMRASLPHGSLDQYGSHGVYTPAHKHTCCCPEAR